MRVDPYNDYGQAEQFAWMLRQAVAWWLVFLIAVLVLVWTWSPLAAWLVCPVVVTGFVYAVRWTRCSLALKRQM